MALEQRERRLFNSSKHRRASAAPDRQFHQRGSMLADPLLERGSVALQQSHTGADDSHRQSTDGGLPYFDNHRTALDETELLSGAKDEAAAASKAVHSRVSQSVLSMKQRATTFFDRERGMKKTHLAHAEASDWVPPTEGGARAEQRARRTLDDDGLRFVPLFSRTPTPPIEGDPQRPVTGGGQHQQPTQRLAHRAPHVVASTGYFPSPSDKVDNTTDEGEEDGEAALISRMMYSDAQARHAAEAAGHPAHSSPRRAMGLRPQTAQLSSFANVRPLHVRRTGSASRSRHVGGASMDQTKGMNGQRLARQFFERLPPAIPPTGVASSTKRYASREGAVEGAASGASPNRANTNLAAPSSASTLAPPPPFAQSPDYYFLQVKIVHAAASLAHWEFTVVLTDVTNPRNALPRHQFRGLHVNQQRHLIFQPPDGVTLDPLRQIPWAVTPASLYGHTLRLEVFSTYPLEAKVIDTMVNYGGGQRQGTAS